MDSRNLVTMMQLQPFNRFYKKALQLRVVCVCTQKRLITPYHPVPWTIAYQASLSMGFSRQEYWSGLPCPSPRDLPDPGVNPRLLCLLHWRQVLLPRYLGSPSLSGPDKPDKYWCMFCTMNEVVIPVQVLHSPVICHLKSHLDSNQGFWVASRVMMALGSEVNEIKNAGHNCTRRQSF